jgi:hypothetical protein
VAVGGVFGGDARTEEENITLLVDVVAGVDGEKVVEDEGVWGEWESVGVVGVEGAESCCVKEGGGGLWGLHDPPIPGIIKKQHVENIKTIAIINNIT